MAFRDSWNPARSDLVVLAPGPCSLTATSYKIAAATVGYSAATVIQAAHHHHHHHHHQLTFRPSPSDHHPDGAEDSYHRHRSSFQDMSSSSSAAINGQDCPVLPRQHVPKSCRCYHNSFTAPCAVLQPYILVRASGVQFHIQGSFRKHASPSCDSFSRTWSRAHCKLFS